MFNPNNNILKKHIFFVRVETKDFFFDVKASIINNTINVRNRVSH